MPALPQDVERDDDGERRIEDLPAGQDRADQAGDDADRGDHVGHDVMAVGDQRRRFLGAAGADQQSSAQTALMTVATPLMARPFQGCSSGRGVCQERQTS